MKPTVHALDGRTRGVHRRARGPAPACHGSPAGTAPAETAGWHRRQSQPANDADDACSAVGGCDPHGPALNGTEADVTCTCLEGFSARRCSTRMDQTADSGGHNTGFRCAADVAERGEL